MLDRRLLAKSLSFILPELSSCIETGRLLPRLWKMFGNDMVKYEFLKCLKLQFRRIFLMLNLRKKEIERVEGNGWYLKKRKHSRHLVNVFIKTINGPLCLRKLHYSMSDLKVKTSIVKTI